MLLEKEIKRRKNKKIFTYIIVLSILTILIIPFIIKYCEQWKFNQGIIKNTSQRVELIDIKELKLWNTTIEELKYNKKYIEVQYENYKIKLDSENLEPQNQLDIQVKKNKSSYQKWEDKEIVEIDITKVEPINLVEQIEINTNELLKDLKEIDIYGIKDETIEYIESKEIQENSLTIELKEEYAKYILVYVPIEEIKVEKEEIEIFKNETYQMQIEVMPEDATTKSIHIDDLEEGSIIKLNENGIIEALEVGNIEFCMEAENGNVKKKINVTVKAKVDGIQIQSEKIQLTEGENNQIEAKILPEEVEDKRLKYESNKPEIAKVTEDGKIEAVKEGNAIISITTIAEPIQKREIAVIVKKKKEEITPVQVQTNNNQNNQMLAGNYINGILVVNKKYTLPSNYAPGTNQEAQKAFNNMKYRASQEGISLKIVSGYRSYQTQAAIYKRNVQLYGEEIANSFSAKPGQSEHQAGLAFDVNSTKWDFKDTVEGKWLAQNCHNYGFIIRYPENKEEKTGYIYEPWHIRYVGVQIATEIKNLGLCLEEYLGI